MVGLDGLEPSTSRLSGVRSNHLSYKPLTGTFLWPAGTFPLERGVCPPSLIGAAGFEPAALWSQTRCATKLRYAPLFLSIKFGRGWGNRTPTNGFGDHCHATWPIPYILCILKLHKNGGEGGIWTLASVSRTTPLAGEPLRPLEYFSTGGEGGIRTHAGFHPNGFQDRLVMTTSIPLHIGDPSAIRTPDTLIKSQVLCLLS